MADGSDHEKPQSAEKHPDFRDVSVEGPRMTPQGRSDGDGEDATDPMGGSAKQGQADKAEG